MTQSTASLSTSPYGMEMPELADHFGHIEPLRPKVVARARRVLGRTHGDHPYDELAAALGLTEGDLRV